MCLAFSIGFIMGSQVGDCFFVNAGAGGKWASGEENVLGAGNPLTRNTKRLFVSRVPSHLAALRKRMLRRA